jgi:hypothetical protein
VIDVPVCRVDLVRKSAVSKFESDFDWINDKEELRVTQDPRNQGLTAKEIKELARDWIVAVNEIKCVKETREGYKDRRHYHYDIVIQKLGGFPLGLYVYMELCNPDESDPAVHLLNAHPP